MMNFDRNGMRNNVKFMLTVFELSEQIGLFLEPGQDLSDLQVAPAVRGLTDDADHTFVHVGWYVVRAHADSPVLLHCQHLGSVILALLILQSVNFKHRTEFKRIVNRTTLVPDGDRKKKLKNAKSESHLECHLKTSVSVNNLNRPRQAVRYRVPGGDCARLMNLRGGDRDWSSSSLTGDSRNCVLFSNFPNCRESCGIV